MEQCSALSLWYPNTLTAVSLLGLLLLQINQIGLLAQLSPMLALQTIHFLVSRFFLTKFRSSLRTWNYCCYKSHLSIPQSIQLGSISYTKIMIAHVVI